MTGRYPGSPPPTGGPPPDAALRVLVVDDSPDERFIVRRGLEGSPDAQFEVVEVDTAAAGLAASREDVFDAVVVDHLLPDRPGLELLRELRQREPDLALVLLTGRGSDALASAALDAGADDYVNKNTLTEPRRVGRAVRGAIERARLRAEVTEGEVALASAHAELLRYQEELEGLVRTRTLDLEREVIQRREAEEALRAQQERYERATRAGLVGIWEVELETKRCFVDDTVRALLGPPPTRLGLEWLASRVDPQDWSEARARMDAHLRGDLEMFEMELRLRPPSGPPGWYVARATSTRDEEGGAVRVSGTLVDTTARKRAEIETDRYAQALARSNAELEQFAHVASHDLRAPLRKIRAFGERIAVDYGPELDERGRDYVQRICTGAVRLERLVDHVFAYSRAQRGSEPAVLVPLERLIRETWSEAVEALEGDGGATLEVAGSIPSISGDRVQLRQLFQNLFSNAVKFRHPDRHLAVRVTAETTQGGGLVLRVRDNGIGFDATDAESIFEPFLRLEDHPSVEGTGMGLAICRRVAERHGGLLRARGLRGVGATFELQLPDQPT